MSDRDLRDALERAQSELKGLQARAEKLERSADDAEQLRAKVKQLEKLHSGTEEWRQRAAELEAKLAETRSELARVKHVGDHSVAGDEIRIDELNRKLDWLTRRSELLESENARLKKANPPGDPYSKVMVAAVFIVLLLVLRLLT